MTRLRHRLARSARRDPRGLAAGVMRYLALRRAVRQALAREPLDEMLRRVDGARTLAPVHPEVLRAAIELGDAIARAPRDTCLQRALARYALLRERGIAATLVIGVDASRVPQERDDIGHAWVEVDGTPLPPEAPGGLVTSLRHPPAPRVDRRLWS